MGLNASQEFLDAQNLHGALAFNELTQCFVHKITAHYDTHLVEVFTPKNNVVDMGGTIKMGKMVDPEVKQIRVLCDDAPDIMYYKKGLGTWESAIAYNGAFVRNY